MKGNPVPPPIPESIRLFILCNGMNWCHLPADGGIYAQHPKLLDEWDIIFDEQARHEQKKRRDRDREAKREGRGSSRGRRKR